MFVSQTGLLSSCFQLLLFLARPQMSNDVGFPCCFHAEITSCSNFVFLECLGFLQDFFVFLVRRLDMSDKALLLLVLQVTIIVRTLEFIGFFI